MLVQAINAGSVVAGIPPAVFGSVLFHPPIRLFNGFIVAPVGLIFPHLSVAEREPIHLTDQRRKPEPMPPAQTEVVRRRFAAPVIDYALHFFAPFRASGTLSFYPTPGRLTPSPM